MREPDFLQQILELIDTDVLGMTLEQKTGLIQTLADQVIQSNGQKLPSCCIIPFVTGRRPIDEADHPGLGSSDNTSMICGFPDPETNKTYILFELYGLESFRAEDVNSLALDVTLSFSGSNNSLKTYPIPGWNKHPVEPMVFEKANRGKPTLRAISTCAAATHNLVVALTPEKDFLPLDWQWDALDQQIRDAATDSDDPFSFGHLFTQMLNVSIRLTQRGIPVAVSQTVLDVCDTRRFGSLYQRVLERLVKPDAEKQAKEAGVKDLDYSFHPWFPALLIGLDKAALYTDALIEDIVHKKRHLTDPRWLMRVGLYLEFLTCIGIFEAVKKDVGDLLTPAEREAYENNPFFAEIRKRVNPKGWRKVWKLREISLPKFGTPQTGPVSAFNLLQKKKVTLAFLQVHHDDLKHAIELAGKNEYNAQETWHRVFRDAERAVLRKTPDAFPELGYLDDIIKDFILWHQKGKNVITGSRFKTIISTVGDQDGLFASACNQYRESMNDVAKWAKHHNLTDYTGSECIPIQVSLLEAYMNDQPAQVKRLQNRDGYAGSPTSLGVTDKLPELYKNSSDEVYELLSEASIFKILTTAERQQLANTVRRIELGPMERIIVQGREGSSLFLIGEGTLEVLVRQADGVDQHIAFLRRGHVVGEISLLTGVPRTATVRATESAVVYEIGKMQYEPIIHSRPALVDELASIMERNLRFNHEHWKAYTLERESDAIGKRIRRFFFGS